MDALSRRKKEISCESLINLNQNFSKNNNIIDKSHLNLFNGIIKMTRNKSLNENKTPIFQTTGIDNKTKISNFIDKTYINEEHLSKKQICQTNNFEDISPVNRITSSKMTRPIKLTFNYKRKNMPKKQNNKIDTFINKCGNKTHKHSYKFHDNFSFFFKLKEKNKIPSKTPYLDKKARKSALNLNSYNLANNDIHSEDDNKNINRISNKTFLGKIKLKENKFINNKVDEVENKNSLLNSDKKSAISIIEENKNSIIFCKNNLDNDKETIKKIDINNNIKQEQISNQQIIKEKKNSNNIIFNILSRPFFCCLNS